MRNPGAGAMGVIDKYSGRDADFELMRAPQVERLPEGVKYDDGKLRFDLIPPGPLAEVARVYTIGARKYEDRNWEKGIIWGRIFRAMISHAYKWLMGERRDPDGQHPLASVAWCALTLMEYERTHPEFDDRPKQAGADEIEAAFRPEKVVPRPTIPQRPGDVIPMTPNPVY